MPALGLIITGRDNTKSYRTMADDVDRTDDWTVDAKRLLDMGYEHEMQDAEEWLEEGHFISQTWFEQGNPPTAVQLSSKRPLMVHTYRRNTIHESYAHDAHPLVAFHQYHLVYRFPDESMQPRSFTMFLARMGRSSKLDESDTSCLAFRAYIASGFSIRNSPLYTTKCTVASPPGATPAPGITLPPLVSGWKHFRK